MKLHELSPNEGSRKARRRVGRGLGSGMEVNISQLNRFEAGDVVDPVSLIEKGILKNVRDGVRILGNGELDKAVTVKAHGFTKTAQEKIEAAGGKVEVL